MQLRRDPQADSHSNLTALLWTVGLMGLAGTVFQAVLPDFLHNQLGVEGDIRGALEVPRELPGLLQIAMVALLAGLSKRRSLGMAFGAGAVAFVGIAFSGTSLPVFVVFMVLWSAAAHVTMPLRDALAMELAGSERRGSVLGSIGAARSLGLIVGTGLVWLLLTLLGMGFRDLFLVSAVVLLLGIFACERVPRVASDPQKGGPKRQAAFSLFKDLLLRRPEYRRYYLLTALFGARKQIFLTFAPWLLVSEYDQKAPALAAAFGVSAAVGIVLRPLLGRAVDKVGERRIIIWESLLVAVMCLAYAVMPLVLPKPTALVVLYGLYVFDDILFFLYISRTTYLSRIARSMGEVAPAAALGGTIDHIASMAVPVVAGVMWTGLGAWSVFLVATGFALANIAAAWPMPRRAR